MRAQIVTVTMNPAIDQTIVLDSLAPGQVHRTRSMTLNAGGKGVNVASCLADWQAGLITMAGVIGSDNKEIFETLCAGKHLDDLMVRVPGETRTNIKLVHGGDTTDINLPGLAVGMAALEKCREFIKDVAQPGTILLLAGSLPPGVKAAFYAEMIADLRSSGAKIVLDTSGAPLTAALNADVLPACIKPNRAEMEAYFGRPLVTREALIEAALSLRARGVALVAISLGAEGALFVGDKTLHASLPAIRAASTVGAGDAMVAGMIAAMAEHADFETTARLATAFAVGKLGQAGPNLPPRETIMSLSKQVKITELEGMKP